MEEMPKLTKCTLLTAFKCVESVRMRNAGRLEEMEVLVNAKKENEEEEEEWELPEPVEILESSEAESSKSESESESESSELSESLVLSEMPEPIVDQPMISTKNDWDRMDRTIEIMSVSDNNYNEEEMKELDLSGFVSLRKIKVGDECFENVKKVNICGLSELESVEIGNKSFRRDDDMKRGSFYLKNCPKLKSLKMGLCSFEDYKVCEIENVDALEVIEMGKLSDWSANFWHASLELKSILIHSE